MNIFDIVGPVMVGPSSSHTAGAVKIGYVSSKLMSEKIIRAEILLYGSFFATGKGHGTDMALVAGLLGMQPDDARIPRSIEIAKKEGMEIVFGKAELEEAHPNSVLLKLTGEDGRQLEVVGESLGGSLINIASIDGLSANVSGAVNAVVSSQMVLAGIRSAIEPDEVIDSMRRIGRQIPPCLRETSREGLAVTPTARKIVEKLES